MPNIKVAIFIGLRYLTDARTGRLSNTSIASLGALILGVTAVILVMSVMNGFREELSKRLLGAIADLELIHPELIHQSTSPALLENVEGAGRFVRFEALIYSEIKTSHVITIFGIEPELEERITLIPEHIVLADWYELKRNLNGLVLGQQLADYLNLSVGDKVKVMTLERPPGGLTPRPKLLTFELVALFQMNSEADYAFGFADLDRTLQAFSLASQKGGWRLSLKNSIATASEIAEIAEKIEAVTGLELSIRSWADSFGSLFQAVQLEKRIMFLLLMFIVFIAVLGIASAQVLAVDQKRSAIAILNTIGMTPTGIMMIFLVQSLVLGLIGIAIGVVAGTALADSIGGFLIWLEELLEISLVSGVYFEQLPAKWQLNDVLLVSSITLALILASSFYPAFSAYRMQPARLLNLTPQ